MHNPLRRTSLGAVLRREIRLNRPDAQTIPAIFFFFNDTATTEIYTLSLHDALPIWRPARPIDEHAMIIQVIAFYAFAAIALASGVMVVSSRNPVHSVLFLILAFFSAAGLFVLMGAEFLAMILVVVYVGAVAVLFLFVVMMLDIDFVELRQGFLRYLPIGALIGIV